LTVIRCGRRKEKREAREKAFCARLVPPVGGGMEEIMLLYPSINEIRKKADSRYTLVILAAKRARDIIDGKPRLSEEVGEVPVSIAADEIYEDLITYSRD
jgi:DNA-directed RNA polymerase subunit omega